MTAWQNCSGRSSESVDRIAEQVGDADGVTLLALLRQRLNKSVREIRAG